MTQERQKADENLTEAQKNSVREEVVYRIKKMPWWVRLFNLFEV